MINRVSVSVFFIQNEPHNSNKVTHRDCHFHHSHHFLDLRCLFNNYQKHKPPTYLHLSSHLCALHTDGQSEFQGQENTKLL